MNIIFAIFLGFFFGLALDRARASNPQKIMGMLALKDFHLMKVILFAIGFSSLLLFIMIVMNAIEPGHLNIKPSYYGVILGGAILGLGFALGGYCPGTCVVALGRGRKDGLAFLLGGLLGAFVYMLVYGLIKDSAIFNPIARGAVTIVDTDLDKYPSLIPGLPKLAVAGPIALFFMVVAYILPERGQED